MRWYWWAAIIWLVLALLGLAFLAGGTQGDDD